MKDVFIYNKEVSSGRWLAATGVAPYFCFESDSREHALEIAKRALRFFEANKDSSNEYDESVPHDTAPICQKC
jgi:hypothetical protein